MKNGKLALVCALVSVSAVAASGPGANVGAREAQAVFIHAGMASTMTTLSGTHLHLHHVINCLEGADGADFSKQAEALSKLSCEAMHGGGAISDLRTDTTAHARLEMALALAKAGAASQDEATARADARQIMALTQAYAGLHKP